MKTRTHILFLSLVILSFATGCKKKSTDTSKPPVNVNNTVAKPGNHWEGKDSNTNQMKVDITSNNNGVGVASVTLVGSTYVYTFKGYCTENGIDDYFYSNGDENSPFTMVRYNAKVGDHYEIMYYGKKITRDVMSINESVAVPGLPTAVQCIQVKETIPPGTQYGGNTPTYVTQILWYFNSHYGIVQAILTPAFKTSANDTMRLMQTNIAAK